MELQTYNEIPQLERNVGCICNPKWGKFKSNGVFVEKETGVEESLPHPLAKEGRIVIPSRRLEADRFIHGLIFIGYDEVRLCGSIKNTFHSGSVLAYLELSIDDGNKMISRMGVMGSDYIQEPANFVKKIALYKPKAWLIKFNNGFVNQMAVISYNRSGFVQAYSIWDV